METVYDWVTLGIFAGLIVLFLERSMKPQTERNDSLLLYLTAGVGCAGANYLGNEGYHLVAIALIVATLAFVFYFLKPFRSRGA